jgi:bifunctional non-homologous end joining protein LigD
MTRAAKKAPARKAKPRKGAASKALATYNAKRDFSRTPEPSGESASETGNSFMVQHHWARRDHYDFRLELDGVLKSWAVTRGPSANPKTKRLAVRTEHHPLCYATFEGTIPQGEYGGGTVMLWDRGTWKSLDANPAKAIENGSLKFALEGERMKGEWALVRLKAEGKRENWLLIKHRDEHAENDDGLVERYTDSVSTGRSKSGIEKGEASKRAADAPRKKSAGWQKFIPPQLCDTRAEPPEGENWIYEIKYDGYRLQVHVQGGEARVMTRNGLDWSAKFPAIVDAAKRLNVSSAIMDGEAVVFDARGISDFPALVASLEHGRSQAVLQAFDLLEIDGEDLRKLPLLERKSRLEKALRRSGTAVRYSGHLSGPGKTVFEKAVAGGAEGIIAKVADGKYVSGRSSGWVKIKGDKRQDVYIVGWTKSDRNRPFASLMTASERSGELVFSGGVGTGFSIARQKEILASLKPLELKKPPNTKGATS